MITPKTEDVTIDVFKTMATTFRVSPDGEQFFYSGGAFSIDGSNVLAREYITNIGTIKVGNLPDPTKAPKWQFGYIQACEVKQVFISYSGASFLQGSVGINLTPDGSFIAPDEFGEIDKLKFPNLKPEEMRPWTKPATERFKFKSDKGIVECNTADGPAGHVRTKVTNDVTHVDNFLRAIVDHRRFCCALVVEEQGTSPLRRIVSHQIWDLRFFFELKWRNKAIASAAPSGSSLSVSNFTFGPPTDAAFATMLTATGSVVVNDILAGRLSQAFTLKSKQFRNETDTTTAPKDFFT